MELAQQLFSYRTPEDRRVAMLLLSATPYRMFTTRNDAGGAGLDADDHYSDFLQTLEFLVDDAARFSTLKTALHRYRRELVRAASGGTHDMASARAQLRSHLLRVMCRRERVGSTEERDGMVRETRQPAPLCAADVKSYLAIEVLREHLDGSDLIVYRKRARLLRFAMSDGKAGSMMTFALQLPCLPLASIHPLALRSGDADVRALMRGSIEPLCESLRPRARGNVPDPAWYWAALLLLDSREASVALLDELVKLRSKEAPTPEADVGDDTEHLTGFAAHVERAREVLTRDTELGAFPDDLLDVLVDLALGSPAISWARTLANFGVDDRERRLLGAQMGEAFRSLFNQPLAIGRLQREDASRYWQATLHYAIDGNLQAILDEYAHLLWEPAAWSNTDRNALMGQVTADAIKAITTKTSTVRPDYYRGHPDRIEPVADGAALRTHFALRYGTARSSDGAHEVREDAVRDAFKSPFYPFVLASTSVGQEGLDFHPWCHSVWHWNLPGNPVDLEQREGRVHRYKGHAVRKNVAERHGHALLQQWRPGLDPWQLLFEIATHSRAPGESELIPCWLARGAHKVERVVPLLPLSREEEQLERLKRNLAIYRVVFGQPRQAELMALIDGGGVSQREIDSWVLRLEPGADADAEGAMGWDGPPLPNAGSDAVLQGR